MSSRVDRFPLLTLYTRPGCSLCEGVEEMLARLAAEGLAEWRRVNIEDDAALLARFADRIPVVAVEGEALFEGRISEYRLRRVLARRRNADIQE